MPIYAGDMERRLDATAAVAATVLLGTLAWSATRQVSRPWPDLLMLVGAAGAYLIGRAQGRRHARTLLGVTTAGIALVVAAYPQILSGRPLARPLHYGNANGALLLIGVVAAAAFAVSTRRTWSIAAWLVACLLTTATYATQSRAAFGCAVAVVITTFVTWRTHRTSATAVATLCICALVMFIGATLLLARQYDGPGTAPDWATSTISERRVALWHDAVVLTRREPLQGVGLGQFPVQSPVAASDADTRYAHSLPLEISAEAGVLAGVATTILLVALAMIGAVRRRGAARVIAVWAVVGVGLQASMDYVYRYPAVVLPAAFVAGVTAAMPKRVGRRLPGRVS